MNVLNKIKIIGLFLFLFSHFLWGQNFQTTIRNIEKKEGLSHEDVSSVVEDARGVIWIGTKFGLNRYDGKKCKPITTEAGLKDNVISGILLHQGRYLLLTHREPLLYSENIISMEVFDTYTEKSATFDTFFQNECPFKWRQVKSCTWINEDLLFEIEGKKQYVFRANKGFIPLSISDNQVVIALSSSGKCWVMEQHKDSIRLIQKEHNGKVPNVTACAILQVKKIKLIHEDKDTTTFAIYYERGKKIEVCILKVASNGTFCKNMCHELDANINFMYARYLPALKCFMEANDDLFVMYDLNGNELYQERFPSTTQFIPVAQHFVENNMLWLCTYHGVKIIQIHPQRFHHILKGKEKKRSFRAISKVGNEMFFNSEEGVFKGVVSPQKVLPMGLSNFVDDKGGLWVANAVTTFYYNPNNQQIKTYNLPLFDPWAIQQDPSGNIIISQTGLFYFNPTTQRLDTMPYGTFQELKKSTGYFFFSLKGNQYLLCTNTGLYEIDIQTHTITGRYWKGGVGKYYLPTSDVRHIYFDNISQQYWIATGQEGLLQWKPQTNYTKLHTFKQGLTNTVHAVYADDFGYLWLSTDNGIVKFNKKTYQSRVFTKEDGLEEEEFNRISHFQDKDGTIYFGGLDGVVYFHPKDFQQSDTKENNCKPFVVEVVQFLGESGQLENLTRAYVATNKIIFSASDRFFTLTLGLECGLRSADAIYYYQVKNYDEKWIKVEGNEITFGRLPYGNQTIIIKAFLSNGMFTGEVLEVPIEVKKPFYLTWLFILAFLCVVAFLIWVRIWELNNRNIALAVEVKKRTETIEQQTVELKQLDELKSKFFANVSHELRTPLTLILAPLSQLLKKKNTADADNHLLQLAYKNGQKLLKLVNEILDLTKLSTASLSIDAKETHLLALMKKIASEFEVLAQRNQLHFQLTIKEHTSEVLVVDRHKVETIVSNLLSNACKFTPPNGNVALIYSETPQSMQFFVIDDGAGISAEDLPHIFDRFYQSKDHKAEGGTGIGLALSKELAILMEGTLTVKSELGKGAEFCLTLPKKAAAVESTITSDFQHAPVIDSHVAFPITTPYHADRPTIMLVEDNHDLQVYIFTLLQSQYNLILANNGQQALDYLKEKKEAQPDVIITDMMMPIMDGYELVQQLKSNPAYQQVPVIMLTARASWQDRQSAMRIGVDDYLTKPFIVEELHARIESLLGNAYARLQSQENGNFDSEEALTENEPDEISLSEEELQNQEWLGEVERYIINHLHDADFSVEQVGANFGMSRFKFSRLIKYKVGLSAIQYIQEIRLTHARDLLESKQTNSVNATALAVGITKVKYFSQQFKKRFGILPSDLLDS